MDDKALWLVPKMIKSWTGFDGTPNIKQITSGLVNVMDLAEDVYLDQQYDWVMSLEVGEHVPATKEVTFVHNIVRHAKKGIVLSWAVKGQPGNNHVNNLDNSEVRLKMFRLGFEPDFKAEQIIREAAILPWFRDTLMVFRPKL
jgi:2-polyprenyl-3-methyl-5-hydroxy-6-metoxy-1,4-benzoquinol methylase